LRIHRRAIFYILIRNIIKPAVAEITIHFLEEVIISVERRKRKVGEL
jgi:hypothetical protein